MEQTLEIIGTIVGLVYLWLEYRASIYLWIAGIIMPAIYIFVYYDAGLYADFGINIYYLGAAIYGWMMWKYGSFVRQKLHLHIKKKTAGTSHYPYANEILPAPRHLYSPLLLSALPGYSFVSPIVMYPGLILSPLPSVLSGMWMLARKYVEQWWAWIVVDIVSAGLYVYKDLNFTAGLYALYTIIAIFWLLQMEEDDGKSGRVIR